MSVKNIETLKQLNSQKAKLEGEIEGLKSVLKQNNKELVTKKESLKRIEDRIKNLNADGSIKVTEHAILRYLERVKGLNIADIEKEILEESIVNTISVLGNGTYPHPKGFKVKVKDNNIVTIINDSCNCR